MELMVRQRSCCLLLVETGKGDSIMEYGGKAAQQQCRQRWGGAVRESRFHTLALLTPSNSPDL